MRDIAELESERRRTDAAAHVGRAARVGCPEKHVARSDATDDRTRHELDIARVASGDAVGGRRRVEGHQLAEGREDRVGVQADGRVGAGEAQVALATSSIGKNTSAIRSLLPTLMS